MDPGRGKECKQADVCSAIDDGHSRRQPDPKLKILFLDKNFPVDRVGLGRVVAFNLDPVRQPVLDYGWLHGRSSNSASIGPSSVSFTCTEIL